MITSPTALRIAPGGAHDEFEARVVAELVARGYAVQRTHRYHDGATVFATYLQRQTSLAALFVRTQADLRVASPATVFALEAKTSLGQETGRLAIEAIPLALRVRESPILPCLYAYKDQARGREVGFWAGVTLPIAAILVPATAAFDVQQEALLRTTFPAVPLRHIPRVRGSNDPFALIESDAVNALPDWRTLVAAVEVAGA